MKKVQLNYIANVSPNSKQKIRLSHTKTKIIDDSRATLTLRLYEKYVPYLNIKVVCTYFWHSIFVAECTAVFRIVIVSLIGCTYREPEALIAWICGDGWWKV